MNSSETHHDALIVGSGAGGGAAAWALTRAGWNVLLLEAGPAYSTKSDYHLDTADWELDTFPLKPGAEGEHRFARLQTLDPAYDHLHSWSRPTGRLVRDGRRRAVSYSHVRAVGGSTLHYTGETHRMHPAAMRMHSDYGVAADWPVGYEELRPWYAQAERLLGVSGPETDAQRPRNETSTQPAHALAWASRRVAEISPRVGMSFVPNHLVALSRPKDLRPPCNYCGQCRRGCPREDKGTVDITFIRAAQATGRLTLRTDCRVTRIQSGPRDRIAQVEYLDPDGDLNAARARHYIIACGAVETPRLLLNSAQAGSQEGLGNESGQVGRNFMETLYWSSTGLHPERLDSFRGLPSDAICWDFNAPNAIPGVIGGTRFTVSTLEADYSGPVNYATRVADGWGREHNRRMHATFGHALSLAGIGEFLPNAHSFVDLDPETRDQDGLPLARIRSHLDTGELKRLDFMANKIRELHGAMGVNEMIEENGSYDLLNATHVFGTCRMGNTPEASVVDANLRSHRWRNLYIMDASVFPSSGGGEAPSLTIHALALRACDRLARGIG